MNITETSQVQLNSSEGNVDDLTVIKGIGPARQRWLRESLNVDTYQVLATLSVDEIESRLKAEGQIVSRDEIEGWIIQAQGLMTVEPPWQQTIIRTNTEDVMPANKLHEKGEWKPFASFVVEFQTRQVEEDQSAENRTTVHHVEADRSETWSGLDRERLCQWMLEQVGESVLQETKPRDLSTTEAQPDALLPLTVEIIQVQAFQPPGTEEPIAIGETGQAFKGSVKGREPFSLAASIKLSGPGAAEVVKAHREYHAQFYAYSLPTGPVIHLGDSEPKTLLEEPSSYSTILPEIMLPTGMYRLRVVGKLKGASKFGYAQMPLLQVV